MAETKRKEDDKRTEKRDDKRKTTHHVGKASEVRMTPPSVAPPATAGGEQKWYDKKFLGMPVWGLLIIVGAIAAYLLYEYMSGNGSGAVVPTPGDGTPPPGGGTTGGGTTGGGTSGSGTGGPTGAGTGDPISGPTSIPVTQPSPITFANAGGTAGVPTNPNRGAYSQRIGTVSAAVPRKAAVTSASQVIVHSATGYGAPQIRAIRAPNAHTYAKPTSRTEPLSRRYNPNTPVRVRLASRVVHNPAPKKPAPRKQGVKTTHAGVRA